MAARAVMRDTLYGICPTCGRTVGLARVASEQGDTRNHMPPPMLRDPAHADQYPSRLGKFFCKGGRTRVLRLRGAAVTRWPAR
jgi:hypothetical protein